LKRRLDLRLRQKDVARKIDVSEFTIRNWERGANEPNVRHIPAIIQFLGKWPCDIGKSLPQLVKTYRRLSGLSLKLFSRKLGIDPDTLSKLETEVSPSRSVMIQVAKHFHPTGQGTDILKSTSILMASTSNAIVDCIAVTIESNIGGHVRKDIVISPP